MPPHDRKRVVVLAAVLLVACGPSTSVGEEGLCGTAIRPPSDSCGNARADPGELCFERKELPIAARWIQVLDVDGDGTADLFSTGDVPAFQGVSLRRGMGDGTFADREHTALPTWSFVELPDGTGFDLLGVGTYDPDDLADEDEEVRLVAYEVNPAGEFEPTLLDSIFAPYTTPVAIGVGEVDADGSYRVYVRLSDAESGEDGDDVYEIRGETATRGAQVRGASGQPRFLPAAARGIWIADFDGDGLEDALQTHEYTKSHHEKQRLYGGLFLEQLHWLVKHDEVACDALGTMNFSGWSYSFDTDRLETEEPVGADASSRAHALARLNADDAFDLLFTNDEGTFVALGALGPSCEPIQSDPLSTEWPDVPPCPELEFVAVEKLADVPWFSIEVADLDGDGMQDIVGLDGSLVHVLLGSR